MDYPSDYFETNRKLLKLAGMWIPNRKKNPKMWLIFLIYNISCIVCNQIFLLCEAVSVSETTKNLSDFVEQSGMITQHLLGSFKVFTIIWHRKEITELFRIIEDDKFKYERSATFQPGKHFHFIKRLTGNVCVAFLNMTSSVPLSMYIKTSVLFVKQSHLNFETRNVICTDLLPYYSWVPFETDTKVSCGLVIMGQAIPMFVYAWQIAAIDTLFVTFALYTKAHLQSLIDAFRSIRERCILQVRLDDTTWQAVQNRELDDGMNAEMRKCTQHLQTIMKICNLIENIYSFITLGQTLVSLFVLISCLYTVSSAPSLSGQFYAQSVYLLVEFVQLGLYCFSSNEIIVTSSALINAIYSSDWLPANKTFRRSMIINMIRMHKPLTISVGKFAPLTLITLTSIIRISYSYFAVLKNISAKQN